MGVTAATLEAWVRTARRGDRIQYHRGLLASDVHPTISTLSVTVRRDLGRTAASALRLHHDGLVHLFQQRLGDEDYAYLAVATGRGSQS